MSPFNRPNFKWKGGDTFPEFALPDLTGDFAKSSEQLPSYIFGSGLRNQARFC
jgi:microcystin-dependent protein